MHRLTFCLCPLPSSCVSIFCSVSGLHASHHSTSAGRRDTSGLCDGKPRRIPPLGWPVYGIFTKLSRLVMQLIGLTFTEAQRRIFCQRGSVGLAMAYSTDHHALKRAGELLSGYKSEADSVGARLTSQFIQLGRLLYQDCPELPHTPIWSVLSNRSPEYACTHDQSAADETGPPWVRFIQLVNHPEIRQRCTAPGCLSSRADGILKRCT